MEKVLENTSWIRNAELYFDSRDVLHVLVEEREPVARIFTTGGYSFYIDSSGHKLPLLQKFSIRVPVVTGFVHGGEWKRKDSILMEQVKEVAGFIYSHPFWNAQIGQIDITPERNFELIPVVGDHIIRIGPGKNVDEKLNRLFVFYRQVLSRAGMNRYAAVDVQFKDQVIGIKKGPVNRIDSIQLEKNIQELMAKASLLNPDAAMLPGQVAPVPFETDSVIKRAPVVKNDSVQPKAVMQRRM
jgi:cell division protein FtsQ